jgi:hypothetical protein
MNFDKFPSAMVGRRQCLPYPMPRNPQKCKNRNLMTKSKLPKFPNQDPSPKTQVLRHRKVQKTEFAHEKAKQPKFPKQDQSPKTKAPHFRKVQKTKSDDQKAKRLDSPIKTKDPRPKPITSEKCKNRNLMTKKQSNLIESSHATWAFARRIKIRWHPRSYSTSFMGRRADRSPCPRNRACSWCG